MKKQLCIYLDILGFKNFLERDINGAAGLLQDYNDILGNGEYNFETFIAGSDSIFILALNPATCISELARFIMECFEFNSRAFSNLSDKNDPSVVQMAVPKILDGKVKIEHESAHWFPLLFRGGISWDDATLFHPPLKTAGETSKSTSVFGPGIVKAVLLEQKGYAGPIIAVDQLAFDNIPDADREFLRKLDDDSELYELLWPLSKWPNGDDIDILYGNIQISIGAVMNLHKAYGSDKAGKHYKSLLMLYVRSAYRALRSAGADEEEATRRLLTINGIAPSFFRWPS